MTGPNKMLRAFRAWWEMNGQHAPGGNTNYEIWVAGWKAAEEEWHRIWHRDTGIPCDGTSPYCPKARKTA